MQKRIFIAINLPLELNEQILNWQKKWFTLSRVEGLNWTKPDNFHITLAFIGEIDEDKIGKVLEVTRAVAKNFKPFEISVGRIHTGPNFNLPRMIWLSGPENKNLSNLAARLIEGLKKAGIKPSDNHGFKLHITLARAKNDELRGVRIDEKFEYSFLVETIEVMESRLMPGGPEYNVLESIKF